MEVTEQQSNNASTSIPNKIPYLLFPRPPSITAISQISKESSVNEKHSSFSSARSSSPITVMSPPSSVQSKSRNATPGFFDLPALSPTASPLAGLDITLQRLFSKEHLLFILDDNVLLGRFSEFIELHKIQYSPVLKRYLTQRKAKLAVEYANAVAHSIHYSSSPLEHRLSRIGAATLEPRFESQMKMELDVLTNLVLPAFVINCLVDVVTEMAETEMAGDNDYSRDYLGELGEVFCLTDPKLEDNPIIYASEEFHKTTQYGTTYAINRNCRFLQGPGTDKKVVAKIGKAIRDGRESNEMLLNYRRDGSPFINLLMCSPLYDDRGKIKYFIGAQIDVTRLVVTERGIESFSQFLQHEEESSIDGDTITQETTTASLLDNLCEKLSLEETEALRRNRKLGLDGKGAANRALATLPVRAPSICNGDITDGRVSRNQAKRVIDSASQIPRGLSPPPDDVQATFHGQLPGVYSHYLLVHPHPSLRIVFVSPALRIPGLLRSALFDKIGGTTTTMNSLSSAFEDGAPVTAKIIWLPNDHEEGWRERQRNKERWMRATPLLGSDDKVGVWMCILVPVRRTLETLSARSLAAFDDDLESRPSTEPGVPSIRHTSRLQRHMYDVQRHSKMPKHLEDEENVLGTSQVNLVEAKPAKADEPPHEPAQPQYKDVNKVGLLGRPHRSLSDSTGISSVSGYSYVPEDRRDNKRDDGVRTRFANMSLKKLKFGRTAKVQEIAIPRGVHAV